MLDPNTSDRETSAPDPPAAGDDGSPRDLAEFVATDLREHHISLIDQWIAFLNQRLGVRPADLLPTESLRDHAPDFLLEIADNVQIPEKNVAHHLLDHVRLYSQLRRDQGYDVEEVVEEFDALAVIVLERGRAAVERYPGDVPPAEAVEVCARIYPVVQQISKAMVGYYRGAEEEERKELSRRLADFSHALVHELKDPLHAAQSGSLLLSDGDLSVGREKLLQEIVQRNLERIRDLLDDIAMLGDAASARAQTESISLPRVIEKAVDQLMASAEARGVSLVVEDSVPDTEIEASGIQIPLHNLISNAIKYSDAAKEERWIRIRAEEDEDGLLHLSVEDNGVGISQDLQGMIFKRHYRAHPDLAEGTGLGLSIAKTIVDQRGGRIWFESEAGKGSTFHLTLDPRGGRSTKGNEIDEDLLGVGTASAPVQSP